MMGDPRREDDSFVVGSGEAVTGGRASFRRGSSRQGRGFGFDTHRRVKRAVVGILHRVQELETREEPLEPLFRDPEALHKTLGLEDIERDVTRAHTAGLGDGEHVVLPRLRSDEVYVRGLHRDLRARAKGTFARRLSRARRGDVHPSSPPRMLVAQIADYSLSQRSPATSPDVRPSRSSASSSASPRAPVASTRRARVTVRRETLRDGSGTVEAG